MRARAQRRLRSFMRLLVRSGTTRPAGEGAFRVEAGDRAAVVTAGDVRELASLGLLVSGDAEIRPTPEARNWLRRGLAGAGDFAAQHRLERRLADGTRINDAESPLRRLAARRVATGRPFLQPHHVEVGERIRRLVERASLVPNTTTNYAGTRIQRGRHAGTPAADIGDMALDARRRLAELRARLSPDCMSVVIDVCGFLKGLQQVESEHGWPQRSAKLVLRIGLDQAALHFGVGAEATGPSCSPLRQWRDQPGRPPMFDKG
ncbi:MAG TPA: DUF6456 domain-containing protein [Devosiaceae bacterium]|nr:DUF6456 domain-containing protein [Devosiaceae bacterium]